MMPTADVRPYESVLDAPDLPRQVAGASKVLPRRNRPPARFPVLFRGRRAAPVLGAVRCVGVAVGDSIFIMRSGGLSGPDPAVLVGGRTRTGVSRSESEGR